MRWLLRFRKLDMRLKDQRQALVDTFINTIYLYDDKVLITFTYKEGTQTVTFGEATEVASEGNGSDLDCIPAMEGTRTPGLLIRSARRAISSIFGSYVSSSFLCDTSQVLSFEFLHPLSDFATICTLCTF